MLVGESRDLFENYAEMTFKKMPQVFVKRTFGIKVPFAEPWLRKNHLLLPRQLLCNHTDFKVTGNAYIFGEKFHTIHHLPRSEVNHTVICIIHGSLTTLFFPTGKKDSQTVIVRSDECIYIPPNLRYKQFNTENKLVVYVRYIFNMEPKFDATKCPPNERQWGILPIYNNATAVSKKSERVLIEPSSFVENFERFYE